MLWAGAVLVAAVGVAADSVLHQRACYHHQTAGTSIYDFVEQDLTGERNISLSDYRGKVNDTHTHTHTLSILVPLLLVPPVTRTRHNTFLTIRQSGTAGDERGDLLRVDQPVPWYECAARFLLQL